MKSVAIHTTKQSAHREWSSLTTLNCTYKSEIKKRYSFVRFRFEWYFTFELNFEIPNADIEKIKKLSELANIWGAKITKN